MFDFKEQSKFTAPEAIALQGEKTPYYVGKKIVPGTTTITKREPDYLTPWANKLGAEGIDVGKYLIHTGNNGTVFHALAEALNNESPLWAPEEYEPYMSTALRELEQYQQFLSDYPIKVLGTELALVHKKRLYGGTIDLLAEMDGIPILIDFKTSDGFYTSAKLQLAAYFELLRANGHNVQRAFIVRFPRDGTAYKIYEVIQLDRWLGRFCDHLSSYYIEEAQKELNADGKWRELRKGGKERLKRMKIK